MADPLKSWLAGWLPPNVKRLLKGEVDQAVWYTGDYASWKDALRESNGYHESMIVDGVAEAIDKVSRGEAVAERDSVLFDQIPYPHQVLVGLLRASVAGHRLSVLDIGGSLGSTYFQCRGILSRLDEIRWNVVEQPSFVECGRRRFQTNELRFFESIDACLAEGGVDVVLLSSVLPYVENPYALLDDVVARGIEHVIVDRTPLLTEEPDRLTVQHVPAHIYGKELSYPAWFLNRENVVARFAGRYNLLFEFDALAGPIRIDGATARDTGFLMELRFEDD
ncbi:MAG: methyltransferase, TIGR04325 family [Planctomycetaceae bacterium]